MTRIARIVSGRVAETPIVLPDGLTIAEAFPVALAAQYVACPDAAVLEGWTYAVDGSGAGSFTAPVAVPPTPAQLLAYASDRQNAVLAGVWSFNVAAAGATAHAVTTKLDQAGQFAMVKVQGWLTLNAQTAGATMPYSNVDFTATTLTVAEADSLVEQAAALDTRGYAILNQVAAGIQASPPTVTTTAQIDAAFAALTA